MLWLVLWGALGAELGAEPAWSCLGRAPIGDVWAVVGGRPRRRLLPELPEQADTCWGQVLAERVVRDHVIVEHPSEVSSTLAASLADAVERSLLVEVETLGWRAPPGAERWRLAVYLNQSDLPGAATAQESCEGESVPLMVVPVSALPDDATLAEVAAHETHHAIQAAYGGAAPFWLWEASATWMEAMVTPTPGWLVFVGAWASRPELGLDEGDRRELPDLLHMYGRAAWLRQVEADHGQEQVRALWEAASELGGPRFRLTLPPIATVGGLDLPDAVARFGGAMAEEAVSGSRGYPEIAASVVDGAQPTGGRVVGGWAQTHLRVAGADGADRTLALHGGDAQQWSAAWVDADGATQRVDWSGSVSLPLPRDAVRIVLSRLHPSAATVGWSVEAAGAIDSPVVDDTDPPPGGEEPRGSCACASAEGRGGVLAAVLVAWAVRRRRQAGVATPRSRW